MLDKPGAATAGEGEITAAMNALRRIVRALRLSSRASEKALGVSAAQLYVLQQLAARSDAPSIAQLAALTATDPSSVSVVVSRLVSAGLCARRASKSDARRAEVSITSAGLALLDRSAPNAGAQPVHDGGYAPTKPPAQPVHDGGYAPTKPPAQPAPSPAAVRAPEPAQGRMLAALQAMAPDRRRALVTGLEEIVAALGVAEQAAPMLFEEDHEGDEPAAY